MAIRVHVACDDTAYRTVIADYLAAENDIEVVGASSEGMLGAAAIDLLAPDVVVLRAAPSSNAAERLQRYREGSHGPAVVAFCAGSEQAARFRAAGVEGVVLDRDPARKLRAAVKDVYRQRRAGRRALSV